MQEDIIEVELSDNRVPIMGKDQRSQTVVNSTTKRVLQSSRIEDMSRRCADSIMILRMVVEDNVGDSIKNSSKSGLALVFC